MEGISKKNKIVPLLLYPVLSFRIEFLFPLSESDLPNVRSSHSLHWSVRSIAGCQNVRFRPSGTWNTIPGFLAFVRLFQTRTSNPMSQRLVSEVSCDADELRKKNISYDDDGRHYLLLTYPVWRFTTFFMLQMWFTSLKRGFVPFVFLMYDTISYRKRNHT